MQTQGMTEIAFIDCEEKKEQFSSDAFIHVDKIKLNLYHRPHKNICQMTMSLNVNFKILVEII